MADSNNQDQVSDKEEDDEADVLDELLIGKSVANALQVFRQRGLIGRNFTKGRNKDETLKKQLDFMKDKNEGQDKSKRSSNQQQ